MNKSINIGSNAGVVKPIIFKLTHKNNSPATEGRFYPGIQGVPSEDVIFDSVSKKTIPIRFSANEESIVKKEQPTYVELTNIMFTNGSLRVYEDQPNLLKYLRSCNWNKSNKNRVKGKAHIFYEYNPEAVAAQAIEDEELEIDARHAAKTMDFDDLLSLAIGVGMNTDRSAKEVRHDMMQFAKAKPREFLEAMDDPKVKRRVEILEAIELGILRKEQRAIYIKETLGDVSIHVVPVGQDPLLSFVEATLSTKEGEDAWKKVEKKRKKLLG